MKQLSGDAGDGDDFWLVGKHPGGWRFGPSMKNDATVDVDRLSRDERSIV